MKKLSLGTTKQDKEKSFWECLAVNYPMPYDHGVINETRFVLSKVRQMGVRLNGSTVMDIGCGTGIFSLPISFMASFVLAIDYSEAMISRMISLLKEKKSENVQVICADWRDIEITSMGLKKAFDVVWASMTPAIKTIYDFLKMEMCSKKWCVYIGWGSKRRNELLEQLYRIHKVAYRPPPGVISAHKILTHIGRKPEVFFFETSWTWKGDIEAAFENFCAYMEVEKRKPKKDEIKRLLEKYQKNGMISHTTYAEQGILVWTPLS